MKIYECIGFTEVADFQLQRRDKSACWNTVSSRFENQIRGRKESDVYSLLKSVV